jgi:hypothetical protein
MPVRPLKDSRPPNRLKAEQRPSLDALDSWFREHLGAGVQAKLLEEEHLSFVIGVRPTDSRDVVIKLRPPERRLTSCYQMHAHLWSQGYPCAEPLLPPTPFGPFVATVERYLPGGDELPEGPERPGLFAEALARLIQTASTFREPFDLAPPSPWLWWDNDEPNFWPPPDDLDVDLNAYPGPAWLDDLALRVGTRLQSTSLEPVIGHGDWWQPNLRWLENRLHAVFDWDSLVYLPEAAIAGAAAAQFSVSVIATTTIEETAAFLDAYALARSRPWTQEEREVAWAAGLWLVCFNAKKQSLEQRLESMQHLIEFGHERARTAGLV